MNIRNMMTLDRILTSLRRSIGVGLVVTLTACGGGGGSASAPTVAATINTAGIAGPPPLTLIPEVDSVNGSVELTLTAKFDANGRPAFFYNGQETSPTIRVNPGDTIHLHFINSLPTFCAAGVETDSNLHFHGLTSAPVVPGDEVISTLAAPGSTVDYSVLVNTDQPPGLYWYHPHPHGLSSYEVGNGMAGAIVVQGIADEVPATAGLRERVIVLGDVPNDSSFSAGEESIERRTQALRRAQDDDEIGSSTCGPETDGTPMINGQPMASIGIKPGETELFRVVNASGHRHFDLSFDGAPITVVAQDGVPIATYPGASQTITASDVVIPPAGRSEFLVTGKTTPIALTSLCYNSGPAGDPDPQAVLGVLTDDSKWPAALQTQGAHVRTAMGLRRSQFYRQALPAPAQERTIAFTEDANGFYLNGVAYSPNAAPAITAQSGTVEEWTLQNASDEVHVFHIHQVHFVVESVNGQAVSNPHWYDTFDIPPQGHGVTGQVIPSVTKVLIDFRDPVIRGIFLYHCHILDHEDAGMMAKIQVI